MTDIEILRDARLTLSDPKKWTKGAYARDSEGKALAFPDSEEASCWCGVGAIWRQKQPLTGGHLPSALKQLYPNRTITLSIVNDDCGYEAVLEVLDRAIELAEENTQLD